MEFYGVRCNNVRGVQGLVLLGGVCRQPPRCLHTFASEAGALRGEICYYLLNSPPNT